MSKAEMTMDAEIEDVGACVEALENLLRFGQTGHRKKIEQLPISPLMRLRAYKEDLSRTIRQRQIALGKHDFQHPEYRRMCERQRLLESLIDELREPMFNKKGFIPDKEEPRS
jgi:hypothetical protein